MKMTGTFQRAMIYEFMLVSALNGLNPDAISKESAGMITGASALLCLSEDEQSNMKKMSEAVAAYIFEHEPIAKSKELRIRLNRDDVPSYFVTNDYRTVICSADNIEIGFMYKLYSARAMHVRFIDMTYLIGRLFMCSPSEDRSTELSDMESDVLKIGNIVDEDERRSFKMALYGRVNQIVIKEILDLADRSPDILRNLFVAMFGNKDMYVIEPKNEHKVRIQAFNLNGSLNCNYTPYPAKIEDIRQPMDYPNMFSVLMEGGWNLTFRLHTASSRVKSFQDFKYDIQLKHGANNMTDLLIKY